MLPSPTHVGHRLCQQWKNAPLSAIQFPDVSNATAVVSRGVVVRTYCAVLYTAMDLALAVPYCMVSSDADCGKWAQRYSSSEGDDVNEGEGTLPSNRSGADLEGSNGRCLSGIGSE